MTKPIETFQALLRELFQFDCADLDFGIYRIMNHKRDVIERFIVEDLPKAVAETLDSGAMAEQSRVAEELLEVRQQISKNLGTDAVDADGKLAEAYRNTPLGEKYLELKENSGGSRGRDVLEAEIFNHLHAFFSRYYQDGDFISKRRYSKHQRYAIPYNGEEVYLHWANSDQYYVKSGEYFHDYSFTSRGVEVNFRLQAADVEKDNVKGDKRFFLPCAEALSWDEEARRLDIPLEYRPLSPQEEITYGKKNLQEAIIAEAAAKIPKQLVKEPEALAALTASKRRSDDGKAVSFLQHHLSQYTRRNTSDFFIHKDLKGFLSRELDFYLKNEVLNLGDMKAAGEGRAEGWFQMMRTIRLVGSKIIDFLSQIEGFQKMLWEKRKFVTDTQYCITIGKIAEHFFADIADCEEQWVEWKELFGINDDQMDLFNSGKDKSGKRVAFLKARPTLVLDTKHFGKDFVDRLLGSFDDLDGITDGVLIHGENWQGLNLLQERYREQVNTIYIDPPYNTSENTFVYKNAYKHSSWLAMIQNRIVMARLFLVRQGVFQCAIDDTETWKLRSVLDTCFGEDNRIATIAIEVNPAGQNIRPNTPALSHDYCHVYANDIDQTKMQERALTEEEKEAYNQKDETGFFLWDNLRRRGGNSRPSDRPGQWYPLYIDRNTMLVSVDSFEGAEEIWPIDPKGERRIWRNNPDGARRDISSGDISVIEKAGRLEIVKKSRMPKGKKPKTLWADSRYSATTHGTKLLIDVVGDQRFSYPKSTHLIVDCVRFWSGANSTILDYFAGSGTTGHAVINLNREDGGQRKFILIELGDHFDTVLVPRIKKVAFTSEWKDGKPSRMATPVEAERSPGIVKYIRLESYEDTLNNIDFDVASDQQMLQFDDYLLKYMLQWETRRSETLLNVKKLSQPFRYTLHIHADGQVRQQIADIPETFNYLIGLRVETRRVYNDDDRRYLVYRGWIDQRRVAVIWRETEGWGKAALVRDKEFVAERQLTTGADEVYVNGDSFIREAKALEPMFKRRMFAETQA